MKQIVFIVVAVTFFISAFAQDKNYLAKVEFQLAEEALAAKKYNEVRKHLDKAVEFLGESNSKIDYLLIYSQYDYIQNSSINEVHKRQVYFDLYNNTKKYLIDHAENPNKDKYAEVYRWQSEIEPKIKSLKDAYAQWYHNAKSFRRTIDSLKYLGLTNWFGEKLSLDGIWRLGRTYDAIVGHYKNSVVKKLEATKAPITDKANTFTGYNYHGSSFVLRSGFTVDNISVHLPNLGMVTFNGETFAPTKAWFNSSNRLFAIKYLRTVRPNQNFYHPLENTWTYGNSQWRRYINGNLAMIEYFNYEKESGLWLILPIDKTEGGDADGNNFRSITTTVNEAYSSSDRNYFRSVFGYNPGINVQGGDVEQNGGCRITKVVEGGAAEAAGLQENDVITRIGYHKIFTFNDLITIIFYYSPGENVEVEFLRNGEKMTRTLTVGKL